MPFLTEVMYQNLERSEDEETGQSLSVHLCNFPKVDESLIDAELSADMEALLRLVSLGSAVRNSVRIKVRQPLAEIKIQPANDSERRAVLRFAEQISEELNVKKVTLHDPGQGPLLRYEIKPNLKSLGPKLGERVKEIQKALTALDPMAVVEKIQAGGSLEVLCGGQAMVLDKNDILMNAKAPEGWAGLGDHGTQLLLDARVTDQLACEGTAREIVRHIQELRKKSALEMEDRIRLSLQTDSSAVREAIETHGSYICAETLAIELTKEPLNGNAHKASIKLQGQNLTIELDKAAPGKS
jgi:isoleucyl-tRNA synthetase